MNTMSIVNVKSKDKLNRYVNEGYRLLLDTDNIYTLIKIY